MWHTVNDETEDEEDDISDAMPECWPYEVFDTEYNRWHSYGYPTPLMELLDPAGLIVDRKVEMMEASDFQSMS